VQREKRKREKKKRLQEQTSRESAKGDLGWAKGMSGGLLGERGKKVKSSRSSPKKGEKKGGGASGGVKYTEPH